MATLIDCEVQSMLHEGRATVYTVLSEHNDQLTKFAHTLMEHEQLDRAQFEAGYKSDISRMFDPNSVL